MLHKVQNESVRSRGHPILSFLYLPDFLICNRVWGGDFGVPLHFLPLSQLSPCTLAKRRYADFVCVGVRLGWCMATRVEEGIRGA